MQTNLYRQYFLKLSVFSLLMSKLTCSFIIARMYDVLMERDKYRPYGLLLGHT